MRQDWVSTKNRIWHLLLIALATGGLAVFSIFGPYPSQVFADAGGVPTRTPTVTPTGTATSPPTLLPTATYTALPTTTLVNLLEVEATSTTSLNVAAQAEPQSAFSLLSCWPLGVVFLLVGVIIAAYLLARRVKLEAQQ
jgi:carbohydrate-binding DOMON domain-containing protein